MRPKKINYVCEMCEHKGSVSYVSERHGHTKRGQRTPTYAAWDTMLSRCYAPSYSEGMIQQKGIQVEQRWRNDFKNFLDDMGEKPHGATLIRLDQDGDFTPENCCWGGSKKNS